MQKKISFIHAADLHLDSPFSGLARLPETIFNEIQSSTFVALERLVDKAIEKDVDFVLLTGDLFDNEKQSLKAQIHLRNAFEKLNNSGINVYLSYGNHDYVNGNAYPITYPDNVFIFENEQVSHFTYKRNGEPLAMIYGFSYENRAVHDKKAEEFFVADEALPFHIAMLHGSLQSNTEHDVYAPFRLSDLTNKPFDYWALGHIHKRSVLSQNPPVIYPGNIQGRNCKESGEKGCYHVVLEETNKRISFIPLQAITFRNLELDMSDCEQPHELEPLIRNILDQEQKPGPQLLSLELHSSNEAHRQWKQNGTIDEIIELINDSALLHSNWQYIFRVQIDFQTSLDSILSSDGEHFIGELIRHADKSTVHPFLDELYQHRHVRKYLQPLSAADEEVIKQEARENLVQKLLKNGG